MQFFQQITRKDPKQIREVELKIEDVLKTTSKSELKRGGMLPLLTHFLKFSDFDSLESVRFRYVVSSAMLQITIGGLFL